MMMMMMMMMMMQAMAYFKVLYQHLPEQAKDNEESNEQLSKAIRQLVESHTCS
jgi:hypothetical protein